MTPTEKLADEIAAEIIAGLRREQDKPFSGLALSPVEAVERMRDWLIAALRASTDRASTDPLLADMLGAFREISKQYENQNLNHVDFRVAAKRTADAMIERAKGMDQPTYTMPREDEIAAAIRSAYPGMDLHGFAGARAVLALSPKGSSEPTSTMAENQTLRELLADERANVRRLTDALKPFTDAVYNDNGDMTVTPCDRAAYTKAYFVMKPVQTSGIPRDENAT
jgi:hypothetical protein